MEDQGTSESFILCVDSDWGKILTCENLIKKCFSFSFFFEKEKCFSMVSRCCMCCGSGDIVDHLLIHCSMAFELWSFIFRMFGVKWVLPQKLLDLLFEWRCHGPNSEI